MLQALVDGSMGAVVLVGSDPLGDFPDRGLAEEALGSAGFVVAVDGFLSASAALADVVLPVAIAHERTGTTTNIEGRVTRLAQKLVSPGQCWPDWMVAAELADRLGAGLGVSSAAELWDEIERLAPSHAGITRLALDTPAARDGVIAPLPASPVRITARRALAPFDPMATPGIDAVEAQGAPPRAGLAEPPGGDELLAVGNGACVQRRRTGPPPFRCAGPCPWRPPRFPPPTATRCGSCRRVGSTTTASCSRRAVPSPRWPLRRRCGPIRMTSGPSGSPTSARVRVRSSRAALELEAVADDGVPRGVVCIDFNLHTDSGHSGDAGDLGDSGVARAGASALIDAGQAVIDVRLETL